MDTLQMELQMKKNLGVFANKLRFKLRNAGFKQGFSTKVEDCAVVVYWKDDTKFINEPRRAFEVIPIEEDVYEVLCYDISSDMEYVFSSDFCSSPEKAVAYMKEMW